jgi:hypothetical protein
MHPFTFTNINSLDNAIISINANIIEITITHTTSDIQTPILHLGDEIIPLAYVTERETLRKPLSLSEAIITPKQNPKTGEHTGHRLCIDHRHINKHTPPIPTYKEILLNTYQPPYPLIPFPSLPFIFPKLPPLPTNYWLDSNIDWDTWNHASNTE